MRLSRIRRWMVPLVAVVLLISVMSAGCIGDIEFAPHEVQNHGNIIAVDSDYIDSSVILELLMSPSTYKPAIFDAVAQYLPENEPVLDLGAGFGIVMANISSKLKVPKNLIAVTANPNMLPLIEQTCSNNKIVATVLQNVVDYDVESGTLVPYSLSMDEQVDEISSLFNDDIVMVPTTQVSTLIMENGLYNETNITLVVETENQFETIITNEPDLKENVKTIIAAFKSLSNLDTARMMNHGLLAGYHPELVSALSPDGYRVIVFSRLDYDATE